MPIASYPDSDTTAGESGTTMDLLVLVNCRHAS
jgi:hypothetical protein